MYVATKDGLLHGLNMSLRLTSKERTSINMSHVIAQISHKLLVIITLSILEGVQSSSPVIAYSVSFKYKYCIAQFLTGEILTEGLHRAI